VPAPADSSAGPVLFVAVSGPPGSGKSTLAQELATQLTLPLVAKDAIKEALMTVLAVPDVAASREAGRAAMAVLLRIAGSCPTGAVLEANFQRTKARTELQRLPGQLVEVFCSCPRQVCIARYRVRARSRAAGHLDADRSDDEIWNEEVSRPVAGGWPVLEVPTDGPVDVPRLVAAVRELQQA